MSAPSFYFFLMILSRDGDPGCRRSLPHQHPRSRQRQFPALLTEFCECPVLAMAFPNPKEKVTSPARRPHSGSWPPLFGRSYPRTPDSIGLCVLPSSLSSHTRLTGGVGNARCGAVRGGSEDSLQGSRRIHLPDPVHSRCSVFVGTVIGFREKSTSIRCARVVNTLVGSRTAVSANLLEFR
jgi:hypothetical protein